MEERQAKLMKAMKEYGVQEERKIQTYEDYAIDGNQDEIELELECAMCFNIMIEPIKFPNKECQHRYCRECMDGLFDRSIMNNSQPNVYAKCPMCRKYCTLVRDMRSNVLVLDSKY